VLLLQLNAVAHDAERIAKTFITRWCDTDEHHRFIVITTVQRQNVARKRMTTLRQW